MAIVSVGSISIAIYSGNIGTMVRLRDTIVPFVVWLSAEGVIATASVWRAKVSKRNAMYPHTDEALTEIRAESGM